MAFIIQCEKCRWQIFNLFKHKRRLHYRNYHSDRVFGYRKKTISEYVIPEDVQLIRNKHSNFYRLVSAYRQRAHKIANINPIALSKTASIPELEPRRYGLQESDEVSFQGIISTEKAEGSVQEALEFLNKTYTGSISAEFSYLETEEETEWFANKYESQVEEKLPDDVRIRIASDLLKSQAFDHFMANKFVSVKRYGGEGAESMMAFFSEFLRLSALDQIQEVVIGMPHRGRLNFLIALLKFPPVKIFAKLKDQPDFPDKYRATGDVLSHFISSVDLENDCGGNLHVSVLYNPSHLEAINPVSMGKTRAKQLWLKDGDYSERNNGKWSDKVLNLQVHGDAAFTGQGINQECLAMSATPHFEIGGSIHLIVNNQLGFTTPADRGRSSRYCTDLAKMISVPVLHVNGDDPEMVLKATRIAFEYQRKFRKDVFVDLNCYRQWGHNEVDDPTFTNPAIYKIIHSRGTVPDLYSAKLIEKKIWTKENANQVVSEFKNWLGDQLVAVDKFVPEDSYFKRQWEGYEQAQDVVTKWDTGVDVNLLFYIGNKSVSYPEDFNIHLNLSKHHVNNRLNKIADGYGLDWSAAEAMAIGSLLYQGYNVRISGQDVGRGTFCNRHIMLIDQVTNNMHIPLNHLHPDQTGFLEIANSILSEEAVLGYEYGMSIENPNNLIIWEAQFGDFFNGAQVIFDTFVSSGETKWLWSTGLTVLLPHGYDGAGPEHSSARIERFLQMTDSQENKPDGDCVNMEVCQPSTPAQYFHLLRRQMLRNFRKPLIIINPKTLLRLPAATSTLHDMAPTTSFQPVIGETMLNPNNVEKVLLTSGKHYYTLLEKRQNLGDKSTAIVRIESFCPFPILQLQEEMLKFKNVKVFVWCQEEPQNMGAWSFIRPRFENLIGYPISYCGRKTMACPAVGVGKWHQQQVIDVTTKPFLIRAT